MEAKKVIVRYGLGPVLVIFLLWFFVAPPQQVGYSPEQPISYSHKLHAGKYNIDCQYCHTGVTRSKKAGVPSLNVCRNCHVSIGYGNKEIQKINQYWEKKKSPEWIRVHNMPDHVRFSHAPHIKALLDQGQPSKMACTYCHGDIDKMDVVAQQKSLNMGFCVNCHRENKEKGAKINCGNCHY